MAVVLRLVADLNVELYGVPLDVIMRNLRDLISHADADGMITNKTEAEAVECVHDCFEIRPGDFGDFDGCRTLSTPAVAGSAAGSNPSPTCGESVSIGVVDDGSISTVAPIARVVASTDEPSSEVRGIRAKVWSDDWAFKVTFNAIPWFADASDEAIEALHAIDWRGNEAADRVALELEEHYPDIGTLMEYCRSKEECGFEVEVNEEDAKAWLRERRPKLLETLLQKETADG